MSAFDPKRTSTRVNTRAGLLAIRRSAGALRATANRSTLVESVSAKIQGADLALGTSDGAFQCAIRNVESQNILVGADIILMVHKPNLHTQRQTVKLRR